MNIADVKKMTDHNQQQQKPQFKLLEELYKENVQIQKEKEQEKIVRQNRQENNRSQIEILEKQAKIDLKIHEEEKERQLKAIEEEKRRKEEAKRLKEEEERLQRAIEEAQRRQEDAEKIRKAQQIAEERRKRREEQRRKEEAERLRKEKNAKLIKFAVGGIFVVLFVLFILPAMMAAIPTSNSIDDYETDTPAENVALGLFTVTDGQNPSKSASFDDGQTGIIYSNTLSFPYGSPYYVLGIAKAIPPVTITASNMVPVNSQASFEVTVKDSSGNTVGSMEFGSSDTKRSKKVTIRAPGDYTVIMDGQYVKSVDIAIEKT